MIRVALEGISLRYAKGPTIFEHLDLSLGGGQGGNGGSSRDATGHVVAIMGASGCGKSTLLRIIAGLLRPDAGRVYFEPRDLRLGYLTQEPVLLRHLSAAQNARYFETLEAQRRFFREDAFTTLAERLGMASIIADRRPVDGLSGGERQRLALLRALSVTPSLMLLDEPCASLDCSVRQEFVAALRREVDSAGLLVVYVTHDRSEAAMIADEIVHLRRTDGPVQIERLRAAAFIAQPPSLTAARAMHPEGLNCVPVWIVGGGIRLGDDRGEGRLIAVVETTPAPLDGTYTAAFEPAVVERALQGAGVPVRVEARSDTLDYLLVVDSHERLLAARPGASPVEAVCLRGRIMLFSAPSDPPVILRVSPPGADAR